MSAKIIEAILPPPPPHMVGDGFRVHNFFPGEPIEEPIAAYGPFLMNTWEEVDQAIRDANQGKYGILE